MPKIAQLRRDIERLRDEAAAAEAVRRLLATPDSIMPPQASKPKPVHRKHKS
jgi:hypothetical protein